MAGVPSMISSARDPGQRRTEDHPRHVAAGFRRAQADAFERLPDVRDVLDADPVQLDVLPIGQIGGVPGVLRRDLADGAQGSRGQQPTVDPDPQHEERVFQLVRLEHRGTAAVDTGRTLRVQTPPAETAPQIARVDAVEAGVTVNVLDPRAAVQTVVVLLHPLVRVQRLPMTHRPLALTPPGVRALTGGARCTCRRALGAHHDGVDLVDGDEGLGPSRPG